MAKKKYPAQTWSKVELLRRTNSILRKHKLAPITARTKKEALTYYGRTVNFFSQAAGGI